MTWPGWYIYIVEGCDTWHRLPEWSGTRDDLGFSRLESERVRARMAGEVILPHLDWESSLDDCEHREMKRFVLPTEHDPIGISIWAVAFHKGDALLASTFRVPWLEASLVGIVRLKVEWVWVNPNRLTPPGPWDSVTDVDCIWNKT